MESLPFLSLEDDFLLNLFELVIVLGATSVNKNNNATINNEKAVSFLYLIKNPTVLNMVLRRINKKEAPLTQREINSIRSVSINVDHFFKTSKLKKLLSYMLCSGFLAINTDKNNGTVYKLSPEGEKVYSCLESEHFLRLKVFAKHIIPLRAKSIGQINSLIGNEFKNYG